MKRFLDWLNAFFATPPAAPHTSATLSAWRYLG